MIQLATLFEFVSFSKGHSVQWSAFTCWVHPNLRSWNTTTSLQATSITGWGRMVGGVGTSLRLGCSKFSLTPLGSTDARITETDLNTRASGNQAVSRWLLRRRTTPDPDSTCGQYFYIIGCYHPEQDAGDWIWQFPLCYHSLVPWLHKSWGLLPVFCDACRQVALGASLQLPSIISWYASPGLLSLFQLARELGQ